MLSTKEKQIVVTLLILLVVYALYHTKRIETFDPKNTKQLFGEAKTNVPNLARINSMIVPLRNHYKTWIVKVPLTPFTAPLILPPLDGKPLPPFLLYKSEYLTPVRNQGECGSCWAFALTDTLSDRTMIATGGRFRSTLSVQQLLSCFDRTGCEGGSPEDACFWLGQTGTGLSTEKLSPYKQQKSLEVVTKCREAQGDVITVDKNSIKSIVQFIEEKGFSKVIMEQNISSMKRELVENGVFYCAMTVYEDLFSYTGLKPYKPEKNSKVIGGHAIEIIGYCNKGEDNRDAFKNYGYWICKNSWGDGWPTKTLIAGIFTIVMGSNICGIESRCGSATPLLRTVTKTLSGTELPLSKLRYESFKDYIQ
jgi:cathepsin B